MAQLPFEGGCECEAIRYRRSALAFIAYACHRLACQRLTASAFAIRIDVPAEALSVSRGPGFSRTCATGEAHLVPTCRIRHG